MATATDWVRYENRERRRSEPAAAPQAQPRPDPERCSRERCRLNAEHRGMCHKHYRAWLTANRGTGTYQCSTEACTSTPHIRLDGCWWCDDCCPIRGQALVDKLVADSKAAS